MGVLDGKAIVVTGAGKGLGRAYAHALGAEGAAVVVNALSAETAERTAEEIKAAGGVAEACGGDVSLEAEAARLIDACVRSFGKIDVLVNNAGIYHSTPVWEETPESLRRAFEVNVAGTFNTTLKALPDMMERRSGAIINTGSGSQMGMPNMSVYGATKGAVASFTYACALDLAPYGVRVNVVDPRGLDPSRRTTDPAHRIPTPEVVAPLVVYLASDRAQAVTGQVIRLDNQTLYLVNHPKLGASAVAEGGWTFELISEYFSETIGRSLEPVGLRARRYEYYDGLENAGPARDLFLAQVRESHGMAPLDGRPGG